MTHTCVGNVTIVGSDNGLSPGRRQAIIWTTSGILLIGPSETMVIVSKMAAISPLPYVNPQKTVMTW